MAISVKLNVFEGPLDLLLHLIDVNQIDIYDIPISLITDQYLAYVDEMQSDNMDVMSEFLVMAATLLRIKSKMLLPPDPAEESEDGEFEDPRTELVQRLLEYKMYKYAAEELRTLQEDAEKTVYRDKQLPKDLKYAAPPVDLNEIVGSLTLNKLNEIFKDVIRRQDYRVDKVRYNYGKIQQEEISLADKLTEVEHFISHKKKFSFKEMLLGQRSRINIIVSFLAVLELIRRGRIGVVQEDLFDDIYISVLDD